MRLAIAMGTDIFLGEKIKSFDKQGNPIDLGRVGEAVFSIRVV